MSNRVILTLSTIATLDRISTGKCMLNLLRDSLSCLSLYFWSKCNISWKDTKSPTELFLFFNSFSLWHSNRPSQWTIIQAEGVFFLASTAGDNKNLSLPCITVERKSRPGSSSSSPLDRALQDGVLHPSPSDPSVSPSQWKAVCELGLWELPGLLFLGIRR